MKIRIPETTFFEFTLDLIDGSVPFNLWLKHRKKINKILDSIKIQPMGIDLGVELDTYKTKKEKISNDIYWITLWKLIYSPKNKKDLFNSIFYNDNGVTKSIYINKQLAEETLNESRDQWIDYINQILNLGTDEKLENIIKIYKAEFEQYYHVDKIEDFIFGISYITFLCNGKSSYNPSSKSRKNDTFDFSFLQLLPIPSY